MSTTEYVLDTRLLTAPGWLEHELAEVRIRRVIPECETVWKGQARELARRFVELQAEVERLQKAKGRFPEIR